MAYEIITDTPANIDTKLARENNIKVIPFSYFIDDKEYTCTDTDSFDAKDYYDKIRGGMKVTTSQINPQQYIDCMKPILDEGKDILFIGLSSGVSGSYESACIASAELRSEYPDRNIQLIDSLAAGMGEGLLVLRAAKCRANGMELEETRARIIKFRKRLYQVFTVDDLMHLRRTGRLSNAGAFIGAILNIKPILKGNEKGQIIAFMKVRGRKQAIKTLADKFAELAKNPEEQTIAISHADCEADALYLKELIVKKCAPKEIMIVDYEPVTGSHVGPGALALFFEGDDEVRNK